MKKRYNFTYTETLTHIIDADNFKEALKKFEERGHSWNLENIIDITTESVGSDEEQTER